MSSSTQKLVWLVRVVLTHHQCDTKSNSVDHTNNDNTISAYAHFTDLSLHLSCHGRGYMPPEYWDRGEISTKSDIYSMGILILEIITGQKNHQIMANKSGQHFIEDVRKRDLYTL